MSLDDSANNITRRFISLSAQEELTYDGEKSERLCEAALDFESKPLYIETTIQHIDELCANCRLLHAKVKPSLYIIDYLQLIITDDKDEVLRIAAISRALRALSKQLDTAFIVTSQFSREGAKDRTRPRMYHLKGSSQIEQDADSIIIMHNPNMDRRESWEENVDVNFYVDKNKNGPVKHFSLSFRPAVYKFSESKKAWGT